MNIVLKLVSQIRLIEYAMGYPKGKTREHYRANLYQDDV